MLRLLAIAVSGLVAFFAFFIGSYAIVGNNNVAAWVGLLFGLIGTPILLLRVWRPPNSGSKCPGGTGLYPECMFVVSVSETEVSVIEPDGKTEKLLLSELQEVVIVTNDSGPSGADVWWLLRGMREGTGCRFPGGATGEDKLLQYVYALPGFNNEAFIKAMGSTSNASFSCWRAGT